LKIILPLETAKHHCNTVTVETVIFKMLQYQLQH